MEWDRVLADWSVDVLERLDEDAFNELPGEATEQRWLGFDPATQGEIAALESRLGTTLPASYAAFLRVSNGWLNVDESTKLWPVDEAGPFSDLRPDILQGWKDGAAATDSDVSDDDYFVYGDDQDPAAFRVAYLDSAVAVGEGDDAFVLLIPEVRLPNGEWEAWFLASWLPGANRFKSFEDLVVQLHADFVEDNEKRRDLGDLS